MGARAQQLLGIKLEEGREAGLMKSINHSVSRVKLFVGRQNRQ